MADPRSLVNRMVRAAKLDPALYDEVKSDSAATGQAVAIVLIGGMASGLGSGIAALLYLKDADISDFLVYAFGGLGLSIVGWLAWSVLSYLLGTTIFRTGETSGATLGGLLRTIGFASSPRVLAFFAFVPVLSVFIVIGVLIWILVAAVIAVRQAMNFSTERAIVTCILGWAIYLALGLVIRFIVD